MGWPLKHPCAPFSCHKNIMSSSFTLVCAVRTKCGFISYWATTLFTSAELITMRSRSQSAHTLCFFLLPQTQTSLGLLRKMVTHICKHTVTMKNRRDMSKFTDTVLQKEKVSDTPAATCMSGHTQLRVDRGIKQKNKHSSPTGGQWATCAGRADTVSSLFKSLCGDFPSSVITAHIHNPWLFCSHKWSW